MSVINMTQWHLDYFRRVERAKQSAMFDVPFFDHIERAKAYRAEHGDPVDNLATLLSSIADCETWQEVIDDPDVYGSPAAPAEPPS